MTITHLRRSFLFRVALNKTINTHTELETNFLIGIYLMNKDLKRCSGNSLYKLLSNVYRMPDKKKMLGMIRSFKSKGLVHISGNGASTSITLTQDAKQFLFDLEKKLKATTLPVNKKGINIKKKRPGLKPLSVFG